MTDFERLTKQIKLAGSLTNAAQHPHAADYKLLARLASLHYEDIARKVKRLKR